MMGKALTGELPCRVTGLVLQEAAQMLNACELSAHFQLRLLLRAHSAQCNTKKLTYKFQSNEIIEAATLNFVAAIELYLLK